MELWERGGRGRCVEFSIQILVDFVSALNQSTSHAQKNAFIFKRLKASKEQGYVRKLGKLDGVSHWTRIKSERQWGLQKFVH